MSSSATDPKVVVALGSASAAATTTGAVSVGPEYAYGLEERVLCFHGPLVYEAKCLKRQQKDNQNKYFIHYNGWNKNWDEWVDESRILKLCPQNQKLQQELKAKHVNHKPVNSNSNGSGSSSSKKRKSLSQPLDTNGAKDGNQLSGNDTNSSSGNKRLRNDKTDNKSDGKGSANNSANAKDNTSSELNSSEKKKKRQTVPAFVESEEAFNSKPEIKIKIPEELKPCLVDDWDLITRQQKLFELPARITVEQILDDYLKQKLASKLTPNKETAVLEVVNGVKDYFNAMVGSQLLYRFERLQYQERLNHSKESGLKMSQIYGSIHLLRLFTKFGQFLAFTSLDEKTIQLLLTHIHDFLKYLSRNSSLFTSNDYSVASPEYLRKTI